MSEVVDLHGRGFIESVSLELVLRGTLNSLKAMDMQHPTVRVGKAATQVAIEHQIKLLKIERAIILREEQRARETVIQEGERTHG